MKMIKQIFFDVDVDEKGNYVSYAQLNFPFYSPEDKGGRVYFKTDKELDKKMSHVVELSLDDVKTLGKNVTRTYSLDVETLENFEQYIDVIMSD